MKLAIWSVTRGAGEVAIEIGKEIDADIFTLSKFGLEEGIKIENFTESLNENWHKYDGHIFIMATGIVVRKIASLIKSKDIDPAVCIIDENRSFVISLLSGHLGGANELANMLGEKFSLLPIITTSSDITGKIAIDTLSQKLNLEMESLKKAKEITSLIVDSKQVDIMLPKNVKIGESGSASGVTIISNRENINIMRLYPKNLVVGIGCRRGSKFETILEGLDLVFKKHNLSKKSIKAIATVDVKADEVGLIKAAKELGYDLIIIDREDIRPVQNLFKGSDFVEKQIGVRCVSEPVAYLASNRNGSFLEKKFIYNGITISVYEEKFDE